MEGLWRRGVHPARRAVHDARRALADPHAAVWTDCDGVRAALPRSKVVRRNLGPKVVQS